MPAQISAETHGKAEGTNPAVADLLHRTRTERGMALVIDDPATIAKVAAIVAAGGAAS